MKVFSTKQLIIFIILSLFLVITDISDILLNNHSFVITQISHFLITLVIITLLFLMFRRVKKTSTELHSSNQRLSSIFDTLDVAIWSHNLKKNKLFITKGIEKLYGYQLDDFYRNPKLWSEVIIDEDYVVIEQRAKRIKLGLITTSIYRIRRLDGEIRWIQDRGIPELDGSRKLVNFTSVLFDITDFKKSEERIQTLAYYDSLTDLPNRNKLKEFVKLETSIKSNRFTLFLLDLDRFKFVNDSKGHTVGDSILIEVAKRFNKVVGLNGTVFRLSGDEFIIVLKDCDLNKVIYVAESILKVFTIPFQIDGNEFHLTTSIGISLYPEDGSNQEELIKHADAAMYLAKEKGKNNYQFYTSDLEQVKQRRLELENGLRKAIDQNQLTLYYQPQINLKTNTVVGAEALVRWLHPTMGLISPNEFIPLSEECGLISDIGDWVLKTAISQTKAWQEEGLKDISMAINISARQFQNNQFLPYVKNTLEVYDLDPSYIELEITENVLQDIDTSIVILNSLKDFGIKLAIDDFGTGYSSLSYLKHLPIDIIKIDKSFVDEIKPGNNSKASIVKAVIEMGKSLNSILIAEGIETKYQADYLLENHCDLGQGYHFSKPLPPEDFKQLLI
jgi:diguanylate cyclase (GGDEF)-like protein/PAS domain S-box-containing protein